MQIAPRFWLDPVRLQDSGGFPRGQLARIVMLVREHENWRFIGRREGIHWPELDEDISVENLLSGARSGESRRSFKQWLAARAPAT